MSKLRTSLDAPIEDDDPAWLVSLDLETNESFSEGEVPLQDGVEEEDDRESYTAIRSGRFKALEKINSRRSLHVETPEMRVRYCFISLGNFFFRSSTEMRVQMHNTGQIKLLLVKRRVLIRIRKKNYKFSKSLITQNRRRNHIPNRNRINR